MAFDFPRVLFSARPKWGGGAAQYIRLQIGRDLARKISLSQAAHRVRLLFGTGSDAGKLQLSVDNEAGNFAVKRNKSGGYSLTINSQTADGLFSLQFPAFAVERCEAIRPENGKPPHFVFNASDEMLRVDDDA
ncbi:hypothetical protein DXH95_02985 [Sphingorhabdus pulchriflava]|uniref:Uncharacterized protein n=1 Tax=Sphingorhabdus pulchriflava TaxID=2292257 RepID=A0A371BFM6_9SPHN|nr:hypothetical protein [Sphingorhabdus pulchriflava]RDV06406.1 hypothetical protein DXH95_02985 [Sphingorhabdus pulchriflava]